MPYFRDIIAGQPVEISDSSNVLGSSSEFASADHIHSHGNRGGGLLHSTATQLQHGFLSSSDKIKIDNVFGYNSGDVSLSGTPAYLSISGQTLTLHQVSLTSEVSGTLQESQFPALTGDITTTAGSLTTSYNSVVPAIKGGTGKSGYIVGDVLYADTTTSLDTLSGNPISTYLMLVSKGDGTVAVSPSWIPVQKSAASNLFFYNDTSDVPTYFQLKNVPSTGPSQNIAATAVVDNSIIASFATNVGIPNATFIPDGIFSVVITASQTGGTKNVSLFYEVYSRSSGGSETLISTSGYTPLLTGINSTYTIDVNVDYAQISNSDRIVVKILSHVTGIGTNPSLMLVIEGTSASRILIPRDVAGDNGASALFLYKENPLSEIQPAASGTNSVAIGSGAYAGATESIAIGKHTNSRHLGAIVQSNGRFNTTGDSQSGRYFLRTVTTSSMITELFLDGVTGTNRLVLPDDSTWTFDITITAHRTDASDGHAGYKASGVIYRGAGASSTMMQGLVSKTTIAESNQEFEINIMADQTNGSLKITAQGQTGKIIRWFAVVDTVEITN